MLLTRLRKNDAVDKTEKVILLIQLKMRNVKSKEGVGCKSSKTTDHLKEKGFSRAFSAEMLIEFSIVGNGNQQTNEITRKYE